MIDPGPALVFCMPLRGHFQRLRPLIAGLVDAGVTTHVFTDRRFAPEVESAGGQFVDLFAGRPIEAADATSMPVPCRFVSFAGHYADAVVAEAAALRPSIVIHDTFAVIGWVVANHLGVPRVNVCAAHNTAPGPTLARLQHDPRVAIAPACHAAVRVLRERHRIPEASPFSYVAGVSPDLNLYCEPPGFLPEEHRTAFGPLAYYGSLSPADIDDRSDASSPFGAGASGTRVYVSFGTVIWSYYEAEALSAMTAVADALAALPDTTALISLGSWERASLASRLTRPNVRVDGYVDQMRVLRDATVFVTHHGLNSTHEAIVHGVPMVSYPFFGDQPHMAALCESLGLAVRLVDAPRAAITPDDVRAGLTRVAAQRAVIAARLAEARERELETMRGRPAVHQRILALMHRRTA